MHRTSGLLPALLLAGCISYGATNSPVTKQNAVEVSELVGRWWKGDSIDDEPACIAFQPLAGNAYRGVVDGCEPGASASIIATFALFGGELIASVQQELSDTTLDVGGMVLSLYTFYLIRTRNDSLFIGPLDAGALRSYLVDHPTELPFALLDGNGPELLLTATPEQLAAFLTAHARDTTLWKSDTDVSRWLVRVR